ncbi:response regulator transcription factor [Saccharibacillus qingshengii]|uniref:response regulator transcription factor n=1 Tax=Saccharibacillus qingshengii TaxID=1763540 RepID=UPI0015525ADF|nr:response regulator [Saccharibacillus qingshengii]
MEMEKSYKVLLVDDEPLAIEGLRWMIDWEKYGFRVDGICENGEEALQHIRSAAPDLVVTDIRMPVMDGLQLIEETRKAGDFSTLFVITSGYDDFDYARRAMRLGVSNYLTKPLMDEETEEMLRRLSGQLGEQGALLTQTRHAEALTERRALSSILFGERRDDSGPVEPALERMSDTAASWVYMRLTANAEWMQAAREIVRSAEESRRCCRWVESGRGLSGIVVGIPADRDPTEEARLFAGELLRSLPGEARGRVRLAAGRSVDRLEELRTSLDSAEEAAQLLFFGGSDFAVHADTASNVLSFDAAELGEADRIAALTESGSKEEIRLALRETFLQFERRRTSPDLVEMFAARIVLRCASVCQELGGDFEETIRRSPFCGGVTLLPNLAETQRRLEDFCLDCHTEASLLAERSGGGVQAQVADFLRSRYTESFTIRELAERFYVHPVYLGQSFARRYGMGIAQFVHDLRIGEACRLLLESDLPSCAIAERVGYKGYPHFLKQFEKKTGLKPAEYRAQALC